MTVLGLELDFGICIGMVNKNRVGVFFSSGFSVFTDESDCFAARLSLNHRYSDFFVLWRGLCRLQPTLTEHEEGIREGWGMEFLGFGGVLFPGAKRALERWRVNKLNGMLKIMVRVA